MPLVSLHDAEARYGKITALSHIELSIHRGERIALVGASGAGKSTLLDLIHQHSQHPARSPKHQTGRRTDRQTTALVPQDFGLVKSLSVFHNIYMGALERHPSWYNLLNLVKPFSARIDEIHPIAEQLGLGEKLFQATGQLSGGQRQRTAIGRALYQASNADSAMVLADEPVSALDRHHSEQALDQLTRGFETSVLAMHDIELALSYSNRVIGLQDGRIVFDRPRAALSVEDITPLYHNDASGVVPGASFGTVPETNPGAT